MQSLWKTLYTVSAEFHVGIIVQKTGALTPGWLCGYFHSPANPVGILNFQVMNTFPYRFHRAS